MPNVDKAFLWAQRKYFVSDELQALASFDTPIPIGFGQTNSQPTTVKMMLNWLDIERGNKILDLGSGSGWTSALMSFLTGSSGYIYAIEKIPELVDLGRLNCQKINIKNVKFYKSGDKLGLPKKAPFDRILVSASATTLPHELIDQLKPDGKLVIPVNNDILEIFKLKNGALDIRKHSGFVFVPLT